MTKRNAWLTVLAAMVLAGCSKQPPPPAADTGADDEAPVAATEPAPAAPTYDRAKMATGMLALIDPAPQCQTFRDQLQAAATAPADQPGAVEPSAIVAQANAAGCAKK